MKHDWGVIECKIGVFNYCCQCGRREFSIGGAEMVEECTPDAQWHIAQAWLADKPRMTPPVRQHSLRLVPKPDDVA